MLLGAEQLEQHRLVGHVGAGRVAEGEARAAVALLEELAHLARVVAGDAELAADLAVDVLGEALGDLDRQAVQVQVVLVAVGGEPLARDVERALADGHDLQRDHVGRAVARGRSR